MDNQLLTVDQLCIFLQVNKTWIYRQTREQNIPFKKVGKYIRFHRGEIEGWLKASHKGPVI